MKEPYMVIDVAKCESCHNCFLACKDEHVGNEWPGYAAPASNTGACWIRIESRERGSYPVIDVAYLPIPCQHCENPPCMKAAKNDAVYKRPDGIVMINPLKAKGQKQLAEVCPYRAVVWNEETQSPQKCTMCSHLLDKGWRKSRCVQSCPTGAMSIHFLEPEEMSALVKAERLQTLFPEKGTKPRVYYRNLYRYTHCFIGGSVAESVDGRDECVEGAKVSLLTDKQERVATRTTDAFGDFRFDALEAGSGSYMLLIVHNGRQATVGPMELKESVNAGVIRV